jgi:hypothetical protein
MEWDSNFGTWFAILISRQLHNIFDGIIEVGLEDRVVLLSKNSIVC